MLHDFTDEQCVAILADCRRAMLPDGCVVIANQDLPSPIDGPHPNLTMDLHMMTLLGGRERPAGEWSALLRQAGLAPGAVIETEVGYTLIQATPV